MSVSISVMRRLPVYLNYLKQLPQETENISATAIAAKLDLGDVLVRKDINIISGAGKPRTGYNVRTLIDDLETFLGYKNKNLAVIVGAGKLGCAMLDYSGFGEYGLHILAAFDEDTKKIGMTDSGKYIFPICDFEEFCRQAKVKIGVITVPAHSAQQVCDLMCKNGIRAIWNFAPTHLTADKNILIQNENMAASLALLSAHLNELDAD
ncbi:MAG: redox-sensing transcriptional repressor Rex [Oscillospiraceae bacterium]